MTPSAARSVTSRSPRRSRPPIRPPPTPSTSDRLDLGYGLMINTQDVPGRRRAGSGAWAGLFNTHFWVDRTTGICASIYTNSLPFITENDAWRTYGEFEEAVYAAL